MTLASNLFAASVNRSIEAPVNLSIEAHKLFSGGSELNRRARRSGGIYRSQI